MAGDVLKPVVQDGFPAVGTSSLHDVLAVVEE
jgi:hypothetical protein